MPGSLVGVHDDAAEDFSVTGRRTHVRFPFGRYLHPVGDDFVQVEIASGIVLFAAAAAALVVANMWTRAYTDLWTYEITFGTGALSITYDLRGWVNNGLMTLFFFVVGMEIKRELVEGELRDRRTAALPVVAAIGGMLVPALIFLAWNPTGLASRGWGITTATDLAFTLAVLALVAPRIPAGLRLFLLALAIVDDTGSVVIITLFYSGHVEISWMLAGMAVLLFLIAASRLRVPLQPLYVPLAFAALWFCTVKANLSGAVVGAVLGLITPARSQDERHVLHRVEAPLHLVASFAIVPLFALANAGIQLGLDDLRAAGSSGITWAIVVARVVGKAVGITLAVALAVRLGLGRLPPSVTRRQILGVGVLAGIGFTVALFIADVAYDGTRLADAKIGILASAIAAGVLGTCFLLRSGGPTIPTGR
ncbi:MAG TPA: Na+/H+ antiporter NhaA [Acidimicrobiia bacterium]|nr:Na+/H+ antiporter NhaA [Acidimicrobiia bacterium]